MKNLIILISCFALIFSSCTKEDKTTVTPGSTISTATPGTGWSLTLFTEPGENKTSHFAGYTFDFAADGTMTAVKGGMTVTGTWKQYPDDGKTKFAITLSTTDVRLMELNDAWELVSKSASFISLKDDNSVSNEQLQFSQ